jgi:hypothetical protein
MSELPACPFLEPHTNEYSPAESIKCMGSFYGDQIERVCGSRCIGGVLQHFSHKTLPQILADVDRCCRNQSAGQVKPNGYRVPEVNKRARESLLAVLALGQQRPELFKHHRVAIIVPMEQLLHT